MSTEDKKLKNKLNIKDDLQNYWENEERLKKVEKELLIEEENKNHTSKKNINFEEPKINYNSFQNESKSKEEKNKQNINLNTKSKNEDGIITILIQLAIGIIIIYSIYGYAKNDTKEEMTKLKKEQTEYNNKMEEQTKDYYYKRQQSYEAVQENFKNFKIKYEAIDSKYDINFNYNMNAIINNLNKTKSKSNDNDYDIEISGNISKYGDLFYRIYKRKTSNKYDNQIINMMEELKKIKFKNQEEMVNFKIYINNNSMDSN